MSTEADIIYFAHRRDECLEQARAAADPTIARLHREFANRYARALPKGNLMLVGDTEKQQSEPV